MPVQHLETVECANPVWPATRRGPQPVCLRLAGQEQPGAIVDHVQDPTSVPPESCQCVTSACQVSLGSSAWRRINAQRGFFCGCGTISPSRRRILQIVETAGTRSCPIPWARW